MVAEMWEVRCAYHLVGHVRSVPMTAAFDSSNLDERRAAVVFFSLVPLLPFLVGLGVMVCVIVGVVGEKLMGTSMRKAGNGGEVQWAGLLT